MFDFFKNLFRSKTPRVTMGQLPEFSYTYDNGEKFPGGYGVTELLTADYWTLRKRSSELFEKNLYARGLIRRLVTNEINVGLHLEATPEEAILGVAEDSLGDWTESTENRFSLWRNNAWICDQSERMTFGSMQAAARMEALVAGDVLVVLRQDPRTGLPRVQLIKGEAVQNPFPNPKTSNEIKHGVEVDASGRQVAYWIKQTDGTSKRLPAFGEKSGRRLAWLVYGTDRRLDDVRGKPLLSLVLQSLKEIDRYRDSTQRKALVLSMLAMYISKGEDKPGTKPLSGGSAVRKGVEVTKVDGAGKARKFQTSEHLPGLVIDELQHGEEPKAFKVDGTVEAFGVFEQAIIQAIAWAHEMPPEILILSFNSNYSASQAAINEFKMYLNKVRTEFGDNFCQPIYTEWLIAEVLAGRVQADGLIEAWRDWSRFDIFAAWTSSDWSGQIKPAVDLSKLVAGYTLAIKEGFITRDRAARETFGTKFSKNAAKLLRENKLFAEFNAPLAEIEAAAKAPKLESDAGKSNAEGQGEDGRDNAVEGMDDSFIRVQLQKAA